jgi:general secretion pathway protein I
MTARRRSHRDGMSLMEVLIALAIFLLCLTAISRLVDMGGDFALSARYQNTGTRLAASKLAEVEAGLVALTQASSGDFSADGDDGWTWTVTPSATDVTNVYAVTVTVSKPFQGRDFQVVLTQTVCDPAQMGTGAEAQPPEPISGTEGME